MCKDSLYIKKKTDYGIYNGTEVKMEDAQNILNWQTKRPLEAKRSFLVFVHTINR